MSQTRAEITESKTPCSNEIPETATTTALAIANTSLTDAGADCVHAVLHTTFGLRLCLFHII